MNTYTREQAIDDVAEILQVNPADVDHHQDLLDQGMDSVRIMELVDLWRRRGAEGIDFIALSEDQRLERWLELLEHHHAETR